MPSKRLEPISVEEVVRRAREAAGSKTCGSCTNRSSVYCLRDDIPPEANDMVLLNAPACSFWTN